MNKFDYEGYNEEKYGSDYWTINRSKHKWFSNYVKLKIFLGWALDVKNKDVFLDVGGGVGNWAFHFLRYFKKVIVLDVSQKALDKIPEKEIAKVKGSATSIPLKDKSVNSILLADVFEHILPYDLNKMISELNRVLCPGGVIVIYTTHYGYGIDLIRKRMFGLMDGRLKKSEKRYSGHLNRLKFEEFENLAKRNGLKIEEHRYYGAVFKQIIEFFKDFIARALEKLKGKKSSRGGQSIKEDIKNIKMPKASMLFLLGLLSRIVYLDILLFGRIYRGSSIFLKIRKPA